jgi:hypothetical protein
MHAQTLKADYAARADRWAGSPFAWIKTLPSRTIGTVGEKLVSGFLASKGFDVTRSPDSEADRLVNGARVEIKFSTLWDAGFYKFQQLRDQNYAFAILLGVSPMDAHCWVVSKQRLLSQRGQPGSGLESQHGGRAGSETAWLSIEPGKVPLWLNDCGGRLSEVSNLVACYSGRKPLK